MATDDDPISPQTALSPTLLTLPLEICERIFEHVFAGQTYWLTENADQNANEKTATPLLVCRQLFFELLPIFRRPINVGTSLSYDRPSRQISAIPNSLPQHPTLFRLFSIRNVPEIRHVHLRIEKLFDVAWRTKSAYFEAYSGLRSIIHTLPGRSRVYSLTTRARQRFWLRMLWNLHNGIAVDPSARCEALRLLFVDRGMSELLHQLGDKGMDEFRAQLELLRWLPPVVISSKPVQVLLEHEVELVVAEDDLYPWIVTIIMDVRTFDVELRFLGNSYEVDCRTHGSRKLLASLCRRHHLLTWPAELMSRFSR